MNDETTVLPKLKDQTESDRLTEARNRGVTLGIVIVGSLVATCALGAGFGAFLMRILVL